MIVKTKVCSGCHKRKGSTQFYKCYSSTSGLQAVCKACSKINQKKYYRDYASRNTYRADHKEEIKAYQDWYYQTHRKQRKTYLKANKEKFLAYGARYRKTHKKELKVYKEANKEFIANKQKEYYRKNKKKINAYQKIYRKRKQYERNNEST